MTDLAYTVPRLAEKWEVTPKTIYTMVKNGHLRPIQGIAHYRFGPAEVERAERGCDLSSTKDTGTSFGEKVDEPSASPRERMTALRLSESLPTSSPAPLQTLEQL